MVDKDGSMFESWVVGWFKMDEIGFGRCGIGFSGAVGAPSDSIVALRLRFLGDGAPRGTFEDDDGAPVAGDVLA